jgi:predicted  nucleic acid-binding Zn-ribbon protein
VTSQEPPFDLTQIAVALIAGGGLQYVVGFLRDRKRVKDATPREIDANILTVSKAKDELEADNARLRAERAEDVARHAGERAEWMRERAALRQEIADMENKLRSLLDEIAELRTRHGI